MWRSAGASPGTARRTCIVFNLLISAAPHSTCKPPRPRPARATRAKGSLSTGMRLEHVQPSDHPLRNPFDRPCALDPPTGADVAARRWHLPVTRERRIQSALVLLITTS